jgi:rSAM/selenodomain-associated transferase 1
MKELALFAKHWQPGRVKTRLGAEIGNDRASELYRLFLVTLLERFASVGDVRSLVYSPADTEMDFRRIVGPLPWQLVPQSEGSLGDRLVAHIERSIGDEREMRSVVMIGSDSPTLSIKTLTAAFHRLEVDDVVLGPTLDGGYYLVGVRRKLPALFQAIPWSTSEVWDQTLWVLRQLHPRVPYSVLPRGYDIDTVADLRRLDDDLRRMPTSEWSDRLRSALKSIVGDKLQTIAKLPKL